MQVHKLIEHPSILDIYISELRDKHIQTDSMRFRKNIERIGEFMAIEISKSLVYNSKSVETPLGLYEGRQLKDDIVIASVLRAGLPLHQGLLNVFDKAKNAFISAFRKPNDSPLGFDIIADYVACPDLNGKTLLLSDPMLATGHSLLAVLEALKPYGAPKNLHFVSIIGSEAGVEHLKVNVNTTNTTLWIADIDQRLNEKNYIIPGLGDAGDLAFGTKL